MHRWPLLSHDVVKVYEAATEVEAALIQQILEEAGIPVVLRSYQVPGYGNIIQRVKGIWGELVVPATFEQAARKQIAEYIDAMTAAPDSGDPPA